ncbi:hypothetical protein IWQ62_000660 [Dispira parvispora]|uniref:Uncharacterized protein n=1 Tax=Dispira parvispora TaxID=1520584 RepID=A0A9W8B068_9FUNG|nr:hypothetical protein IWQ62_000660 [Dispira parvispora]
MRLVFVIGLLGYLSVVKGVGEWCIEDRAPCPELQVAVSHFYHWTVKHMMDKMVTYVHPSLKTINVAGHHICSDYEADIPEVFKFHKKINVSKTITAELSVVNQKVGEEYHCYYFPEKGNATWTIRLPFDDETKVDFVEGMQKDMAWASHAEKVGEEQARDEFVQIEGKEVSQEEFTKFLEPGRKSLSEYPWNPKAPRPKNLKERSDLTRDGESKAANVIVINPILLIGFSILIFITTY